MTDRTNDESSVFDALEQHLHKHNPHDPHDSTAVDLLFKLRRRVMKYAAKAHRTARADGTHPFPVHGAMDIELVAASRIDPGPLDPLREPPENPESYERALWASLEQAGQGLLVWNERTGHLIFGHYRFKLLLEQGASVVEAVAVDVPEEAQERLRARLRRITGWYG